MRVRSVKQQKWGFNFILSEKRPSGNRFAISKTVNYL